jgi:hypothetical protein
MTKAGHLASAETREEAWFLFGGGRWVGRVGTSCLIPATAEANSASGQEK